MLPGIAVTLRALLRRVVSQGRLLRLSGGGITLPGRLLWLPGSIITIPGRRLLLCVIALRGLLLLRGTSGTGRRNNPPAGAGGVRVLRVPAVLFLTFHTVPPAQIIFPL